MSGVAPFSSLDDLDGVVMAAAFNDILEDNLSIFILKVNVPA